MDSRTVHSINLNHLRIFEAVYRLKSMTLAAQELFLTQSGVSQHMNKLEEDIGLSLFIRTRGELFPVAEAHLLYDVCQKTFTHIGDVIGAMKSKSDKKIEGLVRLGVPTDFGNNVVIPLIAPWALLYPDVQIDFIYGYATEMRDRLEKGEIDLAFIDSLKKSPKIESQIVYTESLSLVASMEYLQNKNISLKPKKADPIPSDLEFLEYQHDETVLRMWFQYQYGKKGLPLKIRAWAMSVQGIANFVMQGAGAAVLPDHVIERMRQEGHALHLFKGPRGHLQNEISLAWLKKRPLPAACEEFKKYALKKFSEKPKTTK